MMIFDIEIPEAYFTSVFFLGYIFVIGACLGSFLNVCIYRIPEELSVVSPGSRCPKCLIPITWYDNIPILSWLVLRGKCRSCQTKIAPRYMLVEALTGVLFLMVYLEYGFAWVTLIYWLFVFGLVLGTFVDFDHFILPDRVTIGGMILGVPLSFLCPALHEKATHLASLQESLIGMAVGFGSLYLVVEIGKLLLGKKRVDLDKPMAFSIVERNALPHMIMGDEDSTWDDLFDRPTDKWVLTVEEASHEGISLTDTTILLRPTLVLFGEEEIPPLEMIGLKGTLTSYVYPREAMGFGDVKLMGAIGAFLGWEGAFFTIMFSSLLGSIAGLSMLFLKGKELQSRIPYGPYLAMAAVTWMFWGKDWWVWYLSFVKGTPGL